MKRILTAAAALMMLWGCTDYEGDPEGFSVGRGIYFFNGKGDIGTLSLINDLGVISNDILNVGKWPNHISEYGGTLFVVNSGNNNVQMIDAETAENAGSVELHTGSNPMRSALFQNKLYATNSYGTGIDVYDMNKDSLYTIPITGVPDSCMNGGTDAILLNGDKVFAGVRNVTYDANWNAVYGNEYIVVIDAEADTILTSFEAGVNVADMLVNEENELHVLSTGNRSDIGGFVRVWDLTAADFSTYSTVELGSQPGSMALNSEGMVYVGVSGTSGTWPDWSIFGGIMKYNSVNNEIINGAGDMLYSSSQSGILDICVDRDGDIYAPLFDMNKIVVLQDDKVVAELQAGNGPQGIISFEK